MTIQRDFPIKIRFPRILIPNAITAATIFAGYVAIVETFQGHYVAAAWFILLAGVLDMCDGRVARLIKADSEFGVQFDSLADMVNYGVAPALLFYFMYFKEWGFTGTIIGFLPVFCSAVRLARFNVDADLDAPRLPYFIGLPTTMSAFLLAGFTIMVQDTAAGQNIPQVAALLMIMLAFLMVSTVQYEKHNILSPRYILKTRRFITGTIILITGLLAPQIAFFAWGLLYVLYGLFYSLYVNLRLRMRGKHSV